MIARQSILNFLSIALAFGLGAISTLYLYPTYPGKAFQGLVVASRFPVDNFSENLTTSIGQKNRLL